MGFDTDAARADAFTSTPCLLAPMAPAAATPRPSSPPGPVARSSQAPLAHHPDAQSWQPVAAQGARTPPIPVTTTFDVPGHRILRTLGPVFGVTVRTRAIGPKIVAGLRNLVGGEVATYTSLANQVRHEAMDRMVPECIALGGNAVIGMRFDGSEIMPGNTEVFCYGTAVVLA